MIIREVRTLTRPDGPSPALTFVQLVTDDGTVGLGETYYTPQTVSAYVHEVLAPMLLGVDVTRSGWDWDTAYLASARRVPGGTDLRAQSAVDIAVWDLRGKAAGMPVGDLLGAANELGVRVYNTCAGLRYATATQVSHGQADENDDLWLALNDAGELAASLLGEGFGGMKLWPFDDAARADLGRSITSADLARGVERLERIRDRVGDDIEIMLEGHGLWEPIVAGRILRAVEHLNVTWAEDMIVAHEPAALKRLSRMSSVPLAASEYSGGRWAYRQLLDSQAVGYLHLDPSWCGGITEAQKILALASSHSVTAAMHDCTGPVNLLAGLHLACANRCVGYQEVLRAFLTEVYPTVVDVDWRIVDGRLLPPAVPGIGGSLREDFAEQCEVRISR